ncbi:NAD(P)-dependent alcohol dehydrogenase [Microbacterium maritypicum]|uniref:NAD(P)-dependent alcohol dehydrogenase n=1 Tax=Microbacterium maritypicum TaxID=33918 RepID=UPI00380A7908
MNAAVVWEQGGRFELVDLELAPLRAGEVRVRLVAVGVCHADLIARDQMYPVHLPAVLGHEGAGIVEAVATDVTSLVIGDHVLLSFNFCGECSHCFAGYPGNCVHTAAYNFGGLRLDGGTSLHAGDQPVASWFFGQSSFAERVNVEARIATRVGRDVSLALAAPLGCSFMAGMGAVWNTLNPQQGEGIAIFGVGGVGASAVAAARATGCDPVIAIDVSERNLTVARKLGATHVVNATAEDPVIAIRAITNGAGIAHAVDASGVALVFGQLIDSLAVRGHGVMVGAPPPGETMPLQLNRALSDGLRLSFVLEGDAEPRTFIPRALDAITSGDIDLSPLITYFRFDEINEAIARLEAGDVAKAVLLFDYTSGGVDDDGRH